MSSSSFLLTSVRFISSQGLANVLRLVSGLLVVRMLDPLQYGLYTGMGVYLNYILLSQFGVLNGFAREFPFLMGKAKIAESERLLASAFTITALISIVSGISFVLLAIHYFVNDNNSEGIVAFGYVVIAAVHLLNKKFLRSMYITNVDFRNLSRISLYIGLVNVVSVLLVYVFGFYGLIARGVLLAVYESGLLFRYLTYEFSVSFDLSPIIRMLKIGWPIFINGQIPAITLTIISTLLFTHAGAEEFGLYSLASTFFAAISILPASFGQIIFPRLSKLYGENVNVKEIVLQNLHSVFFQLLLTAVACLIFYIILPLLIREYLPKYVGAIQCARWLVIVAALQSLGAFNSIFNVMDYRFLLSLMLLTGAVINIAFIYTNSQSFSLISADLVAQGMAIGMLVQNMLGVLGLVWIIRAN